MSCVDLGMGSSAADLCAQERQMSGNIFAHHFPPSPSISSITNHFDFSCLAATLRLGPGKHAGVAEISHFLCWHPRPRNTPARIPLPSPTSQHQTIIQLYLKSWKAAGLEQVWEIAIFLPEWCNMVPGWLMARTPRPHLILFAHPGYLQHVCVL